MVRYTLDNGRCNGLQRQSSMLRLSHWTRNSHSGQSLPRHLRNWWHQCTSLPPRGFVLSGWVTTTQNLQEEGKLGQACACMAMHWRVIGASAVHNWWCLLTYWPLLTFQPNPAATYFTGPPPPPPRNSGAPRGQTPTPPTPPSECHCSLGGGCDYLLLDLKRGC